MSRYKEEHGEERPRRSRRVNDQNTTGEKQSRRRRRLTRNQKILIAVCVVLAASIGLVIAYRSLFVRPEIPSLLPDTSAEEEQIDGLQPRVSGERKSDDFYTILLLGRDTGGGGNCDTMMLVSYDVTNQKATVLSIPRDTMVNVAWDVKKINSVYNQKGGDEKGIKALKTEIAQLVGFEPDYTVIVEWEAVGKLVDAVGGVYYEVPRDMDYEDPYQDLSIHINAGYQKLDGSQAMGVVRFRDGKNGYNNGDIGRIETQQGFLKAVIKQLLQVKNVTKIQKFAKIFEENVTTDLSVQNLFWFGKSAILGGLSLDSVNFVTMPYESCMVWSRYYHQKLSYVVPVADELLELVNSSLSPFVEPSKLSDLDIMSVNSDGSISSTTGKVEDSKAAVAPVISTKPTVTEPSGSGETGGETGTETGGETGGTTGETGGEAGGGTTGETGSGTAGETGGETGGETTGETGGETTAPTEPTVPDEPTEPSGETSQNTAA